MNLNFKLTEKQIELLKAVNKYSIIFYGGARGGGKSFGVRAIAIIKSFQIKNLRIGFFRRTFPELRSNHIDPLFSEYPDLAKYYNSSTHTLKIPETGSIIEFNHCNDEKDVFLYQGREYHILIIDEVGQWPESMFWTLLGSNRSSNPKIKPCCIITGNPGGIGHKWLKRIFIDRDLRDVENPKDYLFIQSKVYDCPPLIENDPAYVKRLEAEPNEMRRRAFLDGDWSIFAGQYFDNFRTNIHVLPRDYEILPHWHKFCGFDLGHNHPYVFGAYAVDEDGEIIKFAECGRRGQDPYEIIKEVGETFPDIEKYTIFAGHDCWAKGRDGTKAVVEVFRDAGWNMIRAQVDRLQGAKFLRMLLDWKKDAEGKLIKKPKFYIKENCWRTIKCLPFLVVDDKNPEDVKKIDASEIDEWGGDDPYDETRYAVMSRYTPTLPEARVVQRHSFGWLIEQMDKPNQKIRK